MMSTAACRRLAKAVMGRLRLRRIDARAIRVPRRLAAAAGTPWGPSAGPFRARIELGEEAVAVGTPRSAVKPSSRRGRAGDVRRNPRPVPAAAAGANPKRRRCWPPGPGSVASARSRRGVSGGHGGRRWSSPVSTGGPRRRHPPHRAGEIVVGADDEDRHGVAAAGLDLRGPVISSKEISRALRDDARPRPACRRSTVAPAATSARSEDGHDRVRNGVGIALEHPRGRDLGG